MLFSDLTFLLGFLTTFLIATYLARRSIKARNIILLVFSLVFYAMGDVVYLFLMITSIVVHWIFGLALGATHGGWRRAILIISIIFDVGLLGFYKYAGFFVENVNALFSLSIPVPDIALPIGISFYTFQLMSYVFDVYRRDVPTQKNVFYLGAYLASFPQLIAGPVVRYSTVMEELEDRTVTIDDLACGYRRFILGIGKKVLIADQIAFIVDKLLDGTFAMGDLGALGAWIAVIGYSLQIFYDFSGYSDMAIGMGRMMGFHFLENFNHPYSADSATDFWRRWHISVSSFFRDYIYIPLGGNRVPLPRWIFNVFVVWFLTGLWHGASWNYVLWGLYFGLLLVLEKYPLRALRKIPVLNHIVALFFIVFGWAIFRCEDFGLLGGVVSSMFGANGIGSISKIYNTGVINPVYLIPMFLGILGCIPLVYDKIPKALRRTKAGAIVLDIGSILVLILAILFLTEGSFTPFIYFRF